MKNFIKNPLILLFLITGVIPSAYAAQKMRDLSLSVEETNRQLSTEQTPTNTGNGIGGIGQNYKTNSDNNFLMDANMDRQMRDINMRNNMENGQSQEFDLNSPIIQNSGFQDNILDSNSPTIAGLPPPYRVQNQRKIMNSFCSTGYSQNINLSAEQKSCMDIQRQEACERFGRATVNVQKILSQAVDCESNAVGYKTFGCDDLDTNRIDLLKQYWQDEDVSYTILFLPDMVLNSAANCAASARHGTIK